MEILNFEVEEVDRGLYENVNGYYVDDIMCYFIVG